MATANEINEFLKLEEDASIALIEFKKVNLKQEIQILNWLVKYEYLYNELILLHPNIISENAISTGRAKLSGEVNTYFNIEILRNCIDLESILDKYYYEMLNKYTTLTAEENEKQTPFDDDFDDMNSLKYHLEKRGII